MSATTEHSQLALEKTGNRLWTTLKPWATQIGILLVILLLCVAFGRIQPRFISTTSLALIFKYYSPVAVLALGMTFVILTGGIDLSVGYLMMFLMFVAAASFKRGLDPTLALLASLGASVVIGTAVGMCVALARIPSFIVTLAVMVAAYGATLLVSANQSITDLPAVHTWLGATTFNVGDQPYPITMPVTIALYVLAAFVLGRTSYGRYVYALGSNREAARLNGVRVNLIEVSVYTLMAVCCWLAAWIQLGVNHTADPKIALSDSFELNAIAMVVIGGTTLTGGRGGVGGTALGAVLLCVLFNGLPMLGGQFGDTSWRKLVQGGVIFLGAVLDAIQRRYLRK